MGGRTYRGLPTTVAGGDDRPMADLGAGTEFAGHRIEEVIGRGGMGVVYRAIDLNLDREVAVKVIAPQLAGDEDFRARFRREWRLAASIRHPHVVMIYRADGQRKQAVIRDQAPTGDSARGSLVHGRKNVPGVADNRRGRR